MAESWPSKVHFSGGDLLDGEYVIDADFLNEQYNIALKNFDLSEVHEEGSPLYIYFRAMWIGYAAAAAVIRNHARNNPVDPTLMTEPLSPATPKPPSLKPMTNNQTDWQELCVQLYAALEAHSTTWDDEVLLDRVGTALRRAQPEPEGPTDEELRRRFLIWWREEASAMRPLPEPVGPTDPKLIPLEEHNRRKLMGALPSIPNGIACPKCGKELMDSNPDCILLTHPNQCRVHCPHCDWSGTRF